MEGFNWTEKLCVRSVYHRLPETQKYEEKLKQMSVLTYSGPSPRFVQAVLVEPERQWRKGFVKEMSFKPGVKD